ncbi:hypothetical protein WBG78_04700 [Chryseolinea sp. T2]|uniref:hypothetical protein n=1 Tax=Chryseolinea sp. T2 TaxID=3129255 RepID=UPI0030785865
MRERNSVKKAIIENIDQKRRDPKSNLDRLEFLINSVPDSDTFELEEPILLRNSWRKKAANYLWLALFGCFFIYSMFKYGFNFNSWWSWIILVLVLIATITLFRQFFENKLILEISSEGLTIDDYIFNKWPDIEFLYFKTEYNGEGEFVGTYLVEKLKNEYEHQVLISDLVWSKEELGEMLYRCMRRYQTN